MPAGDSGIRMPYLFMPDSGAEFIRKLRKEWEETICTIRFTA